MMAGVGCKICPNGSEEETKLSLVLPSGAMEVLIRQSVKA